MAYTVFPPSPDREGVNSFDFAAAGSESPRYTTIRKIRLSAGTHQESGEPGHVRLIYILEGEGAFSSEGTQTAVRAGSTIFLTEPECFRLSCVSHAPLVFLRIAVKQD